MTGPNPDTPISAPHESQARDNRETPNLEGSAPGTSPTESPPLSGFPARLFWAFFNIAVAGVVCGFFSEVWWGFDVLASFRVQYGLLLGIGVILGLFQKKGFRTALALFLFLANGVHLLPFLGAPPALTPSSRAVIISNINVHTANTQFDKVLAFIASSNPDIAFFCEVNQEWVDRLQPLAKTHPFTIAKPRADNFGVALFSRIPPQQLEIHDFLAPEIPSIVMTFLLGSETVTLVGTHPLPPRSYMYTTCRNEQMKRIATFFSNRTGHNILTGDLNTPPWAPLFQQLLQEGGLRDTGVGRGLHVTWPQHAWWLLGLPLDHFLVSPGWNVISRTVGPEVGSDHYPVVVTLGLP
jgi:endonuclease/exonuclease/phosphatase (EEP) superfamily protein YafD